MALLIEISLDADTPGDQYKSIDFRNVQMRRWPCKTTADSYNELGANDLLAWLPQPLSRWIPALLYC